MKDQMWCEEANICLVPPEQYYLRVRSFIKIGERRSGQKGKECDI